MTFLAGSFARPMAGESACADGVIMDDRRGRLAVILYDMLGHGSEAALEGEQAQPLLLKLTSQAGHSAAPLVQQAHDVLRASRGAAVSALVAQHESGHITFAGVGNVAARHWAPEGQRLAPRDGVVGQRMRQPREQSITLKHREMLVMHSDGVPSHLDPKQFPEIWVAEPQWAAQRIVEVAGKSHDDASCVVLRFVQGEARW